MKTKKPDFLDAEHLDFLDAKKEELGKPTTKGLYAAHLRIEFLISRDWAGEIVEYWVNERG